MAGRVLVVDDDADIRTMVSAALELEGYCVETACNGAEALQAIERQQPAAVLLDLQMPVLDGWGVASALKDLGLTVPILVMTAAEQAWQSAEAMAADGCLAKPFDLDDLLTAVERVRPE